MPRSCTPPMKSTRLAVNPCPANGAAPPKPDDEQDKGQQDAHSHGCQAKPLRQLEREDREAGDGVQGQAEHLPERIFRLTGSAGVALVRHAGLPEADPRDHGAHEAMALAHLLERVERVAVQQAEVPGFHRDDDVGERLDEAVEQPLIDKRIKVGTIAASRRPFDCVPQKRRDSAQGDGYRGNCARFNLFLYKRFSETFVVFAVSSKPAARRRRRTGRAGPASTYRRAG
jgi:hypothetical protein